MTGNMYLLKKNHRNTLYVVAGCTSKVEAKEVMKNESGNVILDVRTAEEFLEGHIPGAINVANEDIEAEEITHLPDKEQMILVYCRSGSRSKQAAEKLVALGYTNIVEFGGVIFN